jgi:hypothetical protein
MLRTAALPLVALAVVSPMLWSRGPVYKLATMGQLACYALAVAGIALARRPIGRKAPLAVPAYFTLVNLASLRALLNVVRGERVDRWVPRRTLERGRPSVHLLPASTDPSPDDDEHDHEAIA